MSPPLVVVDEHLRYDRVTEPLQRFVKTQQIGVELLQAKGLSDEQIIPFLRSLKRRTFVTIDNWFYKARLCDNTYCLIYFHLAMEQQAQIPSLLRHLFQIAGFRTVRERMGKVVRVGHETIRYYQRNLPGEQTLAW
ncbi:hypothetical protein FJZ31_13025 [Candidatus Poribacteria bacterium]|nr:hypothetical protein [Candidatus Poribacteria bacterium]